MSSMLEVVGPKAGSAPLSYELTELGTVDLAAVFAHFDGSAASGSFLPVVTIRSQNGTILARVFPSSTLAIGDTADVTYAPFLGRAGGGSITLTGSDGIVVTAISGGYDIAANILGSGWSGILTLAVSETRTSTTTPTNVADLAFTVAAGASFYFEALLIFTGGAGANEGPLWTLGEDTTDRGQFSIETRSTVTDLPSISSFRTNRDLFATKSAAAKRTAFIWGTHLGNGGTFRLQMAQNSSSVTPVTLYAGSILRYRRFNL